LDGHQLIQSHLIHAFYFEYKNYVQYGFSPFESDVKVTWRKQITNFFSFLSKLQGEKKLLHFFSPCESDKKKKKFSFFLLLVILTI